MSQPLSGGDIKKDYSNKFFHNYHLSESSFTCPELVRRLIFYYGQPVHDDDRRSFVSFHFTKYLQKKDVNIQ